MKDNNDFSKHVPRVLSSTQDMVRGLFLSVCDAEAVAVSVCGVHVSARSTIGGVTVSTNRDHPGQILNYQDVDTLIAALVGARDAAIAIGKGDAA
jgi:hypothetical protein